MRKNSKPPLSWKLEEYAFGAAALREEIQRHKREDKQHWSPFKAIGIRLLFVYTFVATLVMVGWVILLKVWYHLFKR